MHRDAFNADNSQPNLSGGFDDRGIGIEIKYNVTNDFYLRPLAHVGWSTEFGGSAAKRKARSLPKRRHYFLNPPPVTK